MDEERRSWSSFLGTVAVVAVLLGAGFAAATGYFLGHFSDPKEKTVTVAAGSLGPLSTARAAALSNGRKLRPPSLLNRVRTSCAPRLRHETTSHIHPMPPAGRSFVKRSLLR